MTSTPARARDLGISIGTLPTGPNNAITDVAGVRVGHTTLISGDGPLHVGEGPVRTGVTVIMPNERPWEHPVFAAPFRLNGNGELTGLEWVRESGTLTSHIALTNTHSVGVVRDALIAEEAAVRGADSLFFSLPVVGETWDGVLNDINGFHVRPEHVRQALAAASTGPVAEGSVGGGTGMICHGFKGGIGTASRTVAAGYTVGVLVQANHGERDRLTIDGVPVGRTLEKEFPQEPFFPTGRDSDGSIIVVVATDAPLLPTQCARVARRAALGVGRVGGAGENGSGDIMLCFSTANELTDGFSREADAVSSVQMISNAHMDPLFYATIEATEEAIVNAMVASPAMTGVNGRHVDALPIARVRELLGVDA